MNTFLSRGWTCFLSHPKNCMLQVYYRFHVSSRILNDASVRPKLLRRSCKSLEEQEAKKKKLSLPVLSLLIIPITSFGLGVWQIKRKKWKENLILELSERLSRKPIPLPTNLEDLENLEYCPVTVKGKFHHEREIYLGPRALILKGGKGNISSGSFSENTSGFLVVTPFELSDSGKTILVNRGWISYELFRKKMKKNITEKQDDREFELTGLVRLNEKKQNFGMKNSPESRLFIYRDLNEMAEIANTEPIYIDADSSSTQPEGPVGGQTRIALRNEHLSYICTWFVLGITTYGLWYLRFIRHPQLPW